MSDGNHGTPVEELPGLIAFVWERVINQVNRLLDAHAKFGFVQFKQGLNPSLEDVINAFAFIDFALTKLSESGTLEHDESRIALNIQQCILHMRMLAAALDSQDQVEYDKIIRNLKLQSPC